MKKITLLLMLTLILTSCSGDIETAKRAPELDSVESASAVPPISPAEEYRASWE